MSPDDIPPSNSPLPDSNPPPDYQAFLAHFNASRFFEAHDALEPLWLRQRGTPSDKLLKGLIQLAGAFVHVQKNRGAPALALLARALFHLTPFRPTALGIDVEAAIALARTWQGLLKNAPIPARTLQASTPRLPPPKACAPRRGGYGVNHARPTC